MPDPNSNPENRVNGKYYYIDQIKNLKTCNDNKSISLFHLNTCLLSKNLEMIFNSLSNQQILILMSLLYQNQKSVKINYQ